MLLSNRAHPGAEQPTAVDELLSNMAASADAVIAAMSATLQMGLHRPDTLSPHKADTRRQHTCVGTLQVGQTAPAHTQSRHEAASALPTEGGTQNLMFTPGST